MRFRTITALALTFTLTACTHWRTKAPCDTEQKPATWTSLFDGASLAGWTTEGDRSAWAVKNGEIAVEKPGEGWWLRTERMFRDFELELDVWIPKGGNSGIGLRGSSHGDPAFTGFEIQVFDSHGEEPGLRDCGAVYEAIPPDTMAVNEAGEWNTYRIRLVGDTLDVWLNGTRIHDNEKLDDRGFFRNPDQPLPLNTRATTGYIALQDHGDPVRYRNIRIRDLSPDPEPEGMRSLIAGTDSEGIPEGWFADGAAEWTIENGELIGRNGPGHLFTDDRFTDFELRALVKTNTEGNSGIYVRARPNPDSAWPIGYEAQIDHHDPKNFTGCIYNKAWPDADGPITRDKAWFDYRIRAEGDRIRTWINGQPMVDTTLEEYDEGHIALQGHHPGNVIRLRDIRVLDLSKE